MKKKKKPIGFLCVIVGQSKFLTIFPSFSCKTIVTLDVSPKRYETKQFFVTLKKSIKLEFCGRKKHRFLGFLFTIFRQFKS